MRAWYLTHLFILFFGWLIPYQSFANDEIVETFNGTGLYDSTNGRFVGLDNPNWHINGDGELRDGGYAFYNDPHEDERTHFDEFWRLISVDCGFVERIEIKDAFLSPQDIFSSPTTLNIFRLKHGFERGGMTVWLGENDTNTHDWFLGKFTATPEFFTVPSGTHIALQIHYDNELSLVTFGYDNEVRDTTPPIEFGPFPLPDVGASTVADFEALAGGFGITSGILDSWSFKCDGPLGDFNANGILDVVDIDRLSVEVRLANHHPSFDVNADELVDVRDRTDWVELLRRTYFGDSNLDGEFNSLDLVIAFQGAEYEDSVVGNSTWSTGDWNGDAEFSSQDLVLAFLHGGYEQGPRPVIPTVPEPTHVGICVVMVFWAANRYPKNTKRKCLILFRRPCARSITITSPRS